MRCAMEQEGHFTTELAATLGRMNIEKDQMERRLRDWRAEGVVMIQNHFCADPHLAGVDLSRGGGWWKSWNHHECAVCRDSRDRQRWDKWLGEYLANHRCG